MAYPSPSQVKPIVPRPCEGHRRRFSEADKRRSRSACASGRSPSVVRAGSVRGDETCSGRWTYRPGVLVLELLQPPRPGRAANHRTSLPIQVGRLTDSGFATGVCHRHAIAASLKNQCPKTVMPSSISAPSRPGNSVCGLAASEQLAVDRHRSSCHLVQ